MFAFYTLNVLLSVHAYLFRASLRRQVRRELFSGHSRGEGAQAAELAAFSGMRD